MTDPITGLKLNAEIAKEIQDAAIAALVERHSEKYPFLQDPKRPMYSHAKILLQAYINYRVGRQKHDTLYETAETKLREQHIRGGYRFDPDALVKEVQAIADGIIDSRVRALTPGEKAEAQAAYQEAQGPRARKVSSGKKEPPAIGLG